MGRALRVGLRTQHRWGLNLFMGHVPRVAALPQPIAPKGLRLTAQGCGGHAVTLGDGICHIINPNGVAEPMDENMSPRCASGQMTDDFSAGAVFPGVGSCRENDATPLGLGLGGVGVVPRVRRCRNPGLWDGIPLGFHVPPNSSRMWCGRRWREGNECRPSKRPLA